MGTAGGTPPGRVRQVASLAIAGALIVTSIWLAHVTGGAGAMAFGLAALAAGIGWKWWRGTFRGVRWVAAVALVGSLALWNAVSFTSYVRRENGDTVSQRMATWGRNHGFGPVIDYLETVVYNDPPSRDPADELALRPVASTTTSVAAPTTTAAPDPSTTTTEPPPPPPQAPAALAPFFQPALGGEGQWVPIGWAGGEEAVWATSIRPLPDAGGVVATIAVFDQTHLRAGMFNGHEEPGGTWARGDHIPVDLQPALVAAWNGGFRFDHFKGGYKTEGVELRPMRDGDATLAVATDGRLVLGVYGRDLVDDGTWVSLRQNLIPIVDGGVSQVRRGIREGVWWGADNGDEVYVPRSAACTMADGRLAYLMVGDVDAEQLAQSLINVGCVTAMQLDINGTWPTFFYYEHGPDGSLTPHFLDTRMRGTTRKYLDTSTKEFFAFFDVGLVPEQSVLDA
ncbi:MAG: phosphodiester glycosidase family protein [Acidimicrobiaceae bacterium]|nr:phosphodiester glycosidase family protein [Acidimicrobiaceae bacterium]